MIPVSRTQCLDATLEACWGKPLHKAIRRQAERAAPKFLWSQLAARPPPVSEGSQFLLCERYLEFSYVSTSLRQPKREIAGEFAVTLLHHPPVDRLVVLIGLHEGAKLFDEGLVGRGWIVGWGQSSSSFEIRRASARMATLRPSSSLGSVKTALGTTIGLCFLAEERGWNSMRSS